MSEYDKPLPNPSTQSQPFWEAARGHQLQMQRCGSCGEVLFYPRVICPECWADDLEWETLSGRGVVYTYTVAQHPTHPKFAAEVPYAIAVVELEEGPRITTSIVGCEPEAIEIGMLVVAVYDDVTPDVTLVKFRPAA